MDLEQFRDYRIDSPGLTFTTKYSSPVQYRHRLIRGVRDQLPCKDFQRPPYT